MSINDQQMNGWLGFSGPQGQEAERLREWHSRFFRFAAE
jgi:hypothetical protein